MNAFELNTTIANLRDLQASDLTDYDGVYLGDIYCRLYESNFLEKVRKMLEASVAAGAEAVEVHNLGILRIAHEEFPELPVHVGGFANIYTAAGAEGLRG